MRLNIGGLQRADGWEIFNAQKGPHVDHVGDCRDLNRFKAGKYDMVYASHVLEHVPIKDAVNTVKGWARVLKPGGEMLIAVPDMERLCRIYLDNIATKDRLKISRGIIGGHDDEYDIHMAAYDYMLLVNVLRMAGIENVTRVDSFGIFDDTSEIEMFGVRVSLNVRAVK
jgi:predicted SAM-dependent methyltransferase